MSVNNIQCSIRASLALFVSILFLNPFTNNAIADYEFTNISEKIKTHDLHCETVIEIMDGSLSEAVIRNHRYGEVMHIGVDDTFHDTLSKMSDEEKSNYFIFENAKTKIRYGGDALRIKFDFSEDVLTAPISYQESYFIKAEKRYDDGTSTTFVLTEPVDPNNPRLEPGTIVLNQIRDIPSNSLLPLILSSVCKFVETF